MCGRFTQTHSQQSVLNRFLVKVFNEQIERENRPRYNIAPSQEVPVVLKGSEPEMGRQLVEMKWGLVPHWSKTARLKFNTINARSEGLETSPVFKTAFQRSRCVIPVSGYYEWKAGTSPKQPYYIYSLEPGEILALGGLWDCWKGPNGSELHSFTIVTTAANDEISKVHHRMPVLLKDVDIPDWLGEEDASLPRLKELMQPAEPGQLAMHPVSPAVNKVGNDSEKNLELYEPLEFDF